jgi:outer membrane protein OmpA-like peptidoglycan-associated protein
MVKSASTRPPARVIPKVTTKDRRKPSDEAAEYNPPLGDARAKAAKDYLVQAGIPGDQLSIISYGKDRPVCQEHDEACWQKNRRIHIVAMTASR